MSETWKPIPGYEGIYEVSDMGQVRSLDRIVQRKDGKSRRHDGRILRAVKRGGYWSVILSPAPDAMKRESVHLLVLTTFVGPRPDGEVGRHLDDNRDNNALGNLAWGTPSENMIDAVRNGVHPETRKTHCPKGHPYAGANLFLTKEGHRGCRECRKTWSSTLARRATEGGERDGNA